MKRLGIIAALCLGAAEAAGVTERFARYASMDAVLGKIADQEQASGRLDALQARVDSCDAESATEREVCIVRALFDSQGLRATSNDARPQNNALTHALETGQGSCAALVAVALLLDSEAEPLFDALVFREHVLLIGRTSGRLFDVVENGRILGPREETKYTVAPDGPQQVPAAGFRAYYRENLAARMAAAGMEAQAERELRRIVENHPRIARFRFNLGTLLVRRELWAEAAHQLDVAIRLGWEDADALVNRGVARWRLGRERAARDDWNRALSLDPNHRGAQSNLRQVGPEQ